VRRVDAATGIITTIAGNAPFELIRGLQPGIGAGGYGGDGGPATQALFWNPQHLAIDRAGNLYISEVFNHRVRKVDAVTGIITTVVGTGKEGFAGDGGPATQAQIAGPQAVAFDATGNMYLADGRNKRIRKVDTNGIITTVAGGGTDPLKDGVQGTTVALGPTRTLATDTAGNLFFAEGNNHILKVSPAGVLTLVAGTGTPGFAGDGGPAVQAQYNAPFPRMTVDSAGNLFFADFSNHRIRKVDANGMISTVAGSGPLFPDPGSYAGDGGPATAARLWGPQGIAIDAAGNLIFADQGNNRVRKVIGIAAPGLIAGQ
jgi:sugar lactone lactonase YvrE